MVAKSVIINIFWCILCKNNFLENTDAKGLANSSWLCTIFFREIFNYGYTFHISHSPSLRSQLVQIRVTLLMTSGMEVAPLISRDKSLYNRPILKYVLAQASVFIIGDGIWQRNLVRISLIICRFNFLKSLSELLICLRRRMLRRKENWENHSSMKLSHKIPINQDKVLIKTFLYNLDFHKVYIMCKKWANIIYYLQFQKIFCCDIFKCITLWLPAWPYEHFLRRQLVPLIFLLQNNLPPRITSNKEGLLFIDTTYVYLSIEKEYVHTFPRI